MILLRLAILDGISNSTMKEYDIRIDYSTMYGTFGRGGWFVEYHTNKRIKLGIKNFK